MISDYQDIFECNMVFRRLTRKVFARFSQFQLNFGLLVTPGILSHRNCLRVDFISECQTLCFEIIYTPIIIMKPLQHNGFCFPHQTKQQIRVIVIHCYRSIGKEVCDIFTSLIKIKKRIGPIVDPCSTPR